MGFFGRLFRTKKAFWHGVTAVVNYTVQSGDPVFDLEEKLLAAINAAGVGEYQQFWAPLDWTEIIYEMHGPDADRLFAVVKPVFEAASFMDGAEVTLRYGPDVKGTRTEVVILRSTFRLAV